MDNASTDGSAELVRSEFPWVQLLALSDNLGFGPAVNRVAAQTSAAWIAPANADVAVEPGALRALVGAGARDPGAGAVAPRLVLPDGSTQHSVYRFPTVPFTAAFNAGVYRVSRRARDAMPLEGMWDPDRPRVVDWAIGALLLVRRPAWEAAGGFDETQWMYAEDLDLGLAPGARGLAHAVRAVGAGAPRRVGRDHAGVGRRTHRPVAAGDLRVDASPPRRGPHAHGGGA